ncbi:hypothetical protein Vafri_2708, partial [Volvox africanus]
ASKQDMFTRQREKLLHCVPTATAWCSADGCGNGSSSTRSGNGVSEAVVRVAAVLVANPRKEAIQLASRALQHMERRLSLVNEIFIRKLGAELQGSDHQQQQQQQQQTPLLSPGGIWSQAVGSARGNTAGGTEGDWTEDAARRRQPSAATALTSGLMGRQLPLDGTWAHAGAAVPEALIARTEPEVGPNLEAAAAPEEFRDREQKGTLEAAAWHSGAAASMEMAAPAQGTPYPSPVHNPASTRDCRNPRLPAAAAGEVSESELGRRMRYNPEAATAGMTPLASPPSSPLLVGGTSPPCAATERPDPEPSSRLAMQTSHAHAIPGPTASDGSAADLIQAPLPDVAVVSRELGIAFLHQELHLTSVSSPLVGSPNSPDYTDAAAVSAAPGPQTVPVTNTARQLSIGGETAEAKDGEFSGAAGSGNASDDHHFKTSSIAMPLDCTTATCYDGRDATSGGVAMTADVLKKDAGQMSTMEALSHPSPRTVPQSSPTCQPAHAVHTLMHRMVGVVATPSLSFGPVALNPQDVHPGNGFVAAGPYSYVSAQMPLALRGGTDLPNFQGSPPPAHLRVSPVPAPIKATAPSVPLQHAALPPPSSVTWPTPLLCVTCVPSQNASSSAWTQHTAPLVPLQPTMTSSPRVHRTAVVAADVAAQGQQSAGAPEPWSSEPMHGAAAQAADRRKPVTVSAFAGPSLDLLLEGDYQAAGSLPSSENEVPTGCRSGDGERVASKRVEEVQTARSSAGMAAGGSVGGASKARAAGTPAAIASSGDLHEDQPRNASQDQAQAAPDSTGGDAKQPVGSPSGDDPAEAQGGVEAWSEVHYEQEAGRRCRMEGRWYPGGAAFLSVRIGDDGVNAPDAGLSSGAVDGAAAEGLLGAGTAAALGAVVSAVVQHGVHGADEEGRVLDADENTPSVVGGCSKLDLDLDLDLDLGLDFSPESDSGIRGHVSPPTPKANDTVDGGTAVVAATAAVGDLLGLILPTNSLKYGDGGGVVADTDGLEGGFAGDRCATGDQLQLVREPGQETPLELLRDSLAGLVLEVTPRENCKGP